MGKGYAMDIRRIMDQDLIIGGRGQEVELVYCLEESGVCTFSHFGSSVVESNLLLVDTALPQMLTMLVPWLYDQPGSVALSVSASFLADTNPMGIPDGLKERFYRVVLSRWLGYMVTHGDINRSWENSGVMYNRIEVQYEDRVSVHWSINVEHPSILFAYCVFEKSRPIRCQKDGKMLVRYKLAVRYSSQS